MIRVATVVAVAKAEDMVVVVAAAKTLSGHNYAKFSAIVVFFCTFHLKY